MDFSPNDGTRCEVPHPSLDVILKRPEFILFRFSAKLIKNQFWQRISGFWYCKLLNSISLNWCFSLQIEAFIWPIYVLVLRLVLCSLLMRGCTESSTIFVKPNLAKRNSGTLRPWATITWKFHYKIFPRNV